MFCTSTRMHRQDGSTVSNKTICLLVFIIPSIKSSLGIRPSLFLSIFRKRSVKRDFLWFMNLRNCKQNTQWKYLEKKNLY